MTNTPAPPPAPPRATLPPPPAKRSTAAAAPAGAAAAIGTISAEFTPPRIVLNATEGFGKTSCGAFAPRPLILMAVGETGAKTLMASGQIPTIDGADITDWAQLKATLDYLTLTDTGHQTLVMDALSGFEKMCHQYICTTKFKGEWGDDGFGAYAKGYDLAVNEWLLMLAQLDRLRAVRGMTILLLSHTMIKTHKNPMGTDFDRYVSDVHPKTWAVTAKWADCVLFGNFFTVVEGAPKSGKGKGKGIGGTERVIYTTRRDAWDAKNRYGMPEVLDLTAKAADNWNVIWAAITKENTNAATE